MNFRAISKMKYAVLVLAAALSSNAHNVNRQAPYPAADNSTTIHSSDGPLSNSPVSNPSMGTPTTTKRVTVTRNRTSTATTTSPPSLSTCCYLWPGGVGVNTWWSSSINVTVATVITNWIQYLDTLVPANSTTITIANATNFYGKMKAGQYVTYSEVGPPTATTTVTVCAHDRVHEPCTQSTTRAVTLRSHTTFIAQTMTVPGVPGGLLPIEADQLYGSTFISNATAATFPLQGLTIQSPTPYFSYNGLGLWTSRDCVEPTVVTSTTRDFRTTVDGTLVTATSFYPTYTETPFPKGAYHDGGNVMGDYNTTIVRPFPDGIYTDWDFNAWMDGISAGPLAGMTDAYTFKLDDDLAEFFASIPSLRDRYPDIDIAKCIPLLGGGEPSVHVPVNQLIATVHSTYTMGHAKSSSVKTSAAEPVPVPSSLTTPHEAAPTPTTPPSDPVSPSEPDDDSPTTEQPKNPDTPNPPANGPQPTAAQPVEDQPPATGTEPSSAHIGDLIAGVIGLLPGAAGNTEQAPTQPPRPGTQDGSPQNAGPQNLQQDGQHQTGQAQNDQSNAQPHHEESQNTTPQAGQSQVGQQVSQQQNKQQQDEQPQEHTNETPVENAVVINGKTAVIAPPDSSATTPPPHVMLGGILVPVNSESEYVFQSQTLAPGGSPITVDGSTYSLASGGTAVVVNGKSSDIGTPQGPTVSLGGYRATPIAYGAYILADGGVLSPGGPATTIQGTTYSLPRLPITDLPKTSQGSLTGLVLPETTLLPGSSVVQSGTTYSLPASGGGIYINGVYTALPTASPGSPITLPNNVLATPTVIPDLVVASQTLVPGGPPITVSGTTYSLSGSNVVAIAASTTYTQAWSEFKVAATATRRASSGRTSMSNASSSRSFASESSPATTAAPDASVSPGGESGPSKTSTSGASKNTDLLGAVCTAILSVAFLMFLM